MPLEHVKITYASATQSSPNHSNEDQQLLLPKHRFFAVADGLGGHQGGAKASHTAITSLHDSIYALYSTDQRYELETLTTALSHAFTQANAHLYQPDQICGTTLCALLFDGRFAIHAHVGDTRLYRLRHNQLDLLTLDHSMSQHLKMQKAQNATACQHQLTRAIGCEPTIKTTVGCQVAFPHDRFLICTDGVYSHLSTAHIQEIMENPSLQRSCDLLISTARLRGSTDDATAIIVQVELPQA